MLAIVASMAISYQGPVRATQARMILAPQDITIPKSPKEVATAASLSVQAALGEGVRRLEVTCPDGMLFFGGVGAQNIGDPYARADAVTKAKGDRELAYIVCEMFQNLGDSVACVLPEEAIPFAEREWRKGGLQSRLITSPAQLRPGAVSGGFAGGAASAVAGSPRVVVCTRANKAMLSALQPIIEPLGNEVVVVLVNPARLKSGKGRSGYEAAFVLRDNPHPKWRGGFLYRPYPQRWALGVAGAGGRPVIHGRSEARPTLDELESGFTKIQDDTSLVSGGAMSAVGAAAALERVGAGSMTFAGEVAAAAREEQAATEPQEILPGADKIRKFFGVKD